MRLTIAVSHAGGIKVFDGEDEIAKGVFDNNLIAVGRRLLLRGDGKTMRFKITALAEEHGTELFAVGECEEIE